MNTLLSQKEIGQRISELRKRKGLSQENLAKSVNIPRSSLAQIELGNRSLNIIEIKRFSMVLGFSLDDFMSDNFSTCNEIEADYVVKSKSTKERISTPTLNVDKFKNVLLYILEKCAGKPNVGETTIYNLLYFSDFNHYEMHEEHLTGATYRKLPIGSVPQKSDSIIKQMIDEGKLQRVKTCYHGLPQTRYLPLEKAKLTELLASEKEIIDRVIEQMSDWSTSAISSYSLKDMPCMATKNGEEINYELAFYRETPFSVRNYYEDTEEQ